MPRFLINAQVEIELEYTDAVQEVARAHLFEVTAEQIAQGGAIVGDSNEAVMHAPTGAGLIFAAILKDGSEGKPVKVIRKDVKVTTLG